MLLKLGVTELRIKIKLLHLPHLANLHGCITGKVLDHLEYTHFLCHLQIVHNVLAELLLKLLKIDLAFP